MPKIWRVLQQSTPYCYRYGSLLTKGMSAIRRHAPLIVILLMGIAVRGFYLWEISSYPDFSVPLGGGDTELSHMLAQKVAAGDFLLREDAFHYSSSPFYSYFLGACYALFGDSFWTARLVNTALGMGSILLMFLLAQRLFKRNSVAYLAVCGAALYGPFVVFDTSMYKTSLEIFMLAMSLLLLVRALTAENRLFWFLSGLALGLTFSVQAQVAVFIVLFSLYFFAEPFIETAHEGREKIKLFINRLAMIGLLISGIFLSLLPFALRNYYVDHNVVFGNHLSGINFYIGNHKGAWGGFSSVEGVRANPAGHFYDARRVAEKDTGKSLTAQQVSSYWKNRALEYIFHNKTDFLSLLREKARLFFSFYEMSDYQYLTKRSPYLAGLLDIALLLPLGMAGLILSFPKHRKLWLVHMFILAYFAAMLITFVTARYRISVVYILWPFAGFFVVTVRDWVREKDLYRLALALLLLVYFVVLGASHPVKQLMYDKNIRSEEMRMNACKKEGKILVQMRSGFYRTQKEKSAAWLEIAKIRYSLYDNEGAVRILRQALVEDPENTDIKKTISGIIQATGGNSVNSEVL